MEHSHKTAFERLASKYGLEKNIDKLCEIDAINLIYYDVDTLRKFSEALRPAGQNPDWIRAEIRRIAYHLTSVKCSDNYHVVLLHLGYPDAFVKTLDKFTRYEYLRESGLLLDLIELQCRQIDVAFEDITERELKSNIVIKKLLGARALNPISLKTDLKEQFDVTQLKTKPQGFYDLDDPKYDPARRKMYTSISKALTLKNSSWACETSRSVRHLTHGSVLMNMFKNSIYDLLGHFDQYEQAKYLLNASKFKTANRLVSQLKERFPQHNVIRELTLKKASPNSNKPLYLDIVIELNKNENRIAIEVQGPQHADKDHHFNSRKGAYESTVKCDYRKFHWCHTNGIELFYVSIEDLEKNNVVNRLSEQGLDFETLAFTDCGSEGKIEYLVDSRLVGEEFLSPDTILSS